MTNTEALPVNAIEVRGLEKTYAGSKKSPPKTALRGVDLSNAIADTLSGSRCRHEHDCCGCPCTYADVRRVARREYAVSLHTT